MGPKNEVEYADLEKPKKFILIMPDVATLQLWCRGLTLGVATLNFACKYNVATLGFNVTTLDFNVVTLVFGVATLHSGCL